MNLETARTTHTGIETNSDARDLRLDEQLAQDGWVRRVIAGPVHLREQVERFWSEGLEVHLEPLPPTECSPYTLATSFYRVIYTRSTD